MTFLFALRIKATKNFRKCILVFEFREVCSRVKNAAKVIKNITVDVLSGIYRLLTIAMTRILCYEFTLMNGVISPLF